METVRLNRYLSSCGLGSRRSCEDLISAGRVEINGRPADTPGIQVAPGDEVKVDGEPARPARTNVVVLYKPARCLCTRSDPQGRQTIYELLPRELAHLAHVGRLDRESEGLLILTNSGDLSHRLTHPRSKVEKEYHVLIHRAFETRHRKPMLEGIETEEGLATAVAVKALEPRLIRVVLQQGLKRQIRLMFEALGYSVERLVRVRIGGFTDPALKPGKWRRLTEAEIEKLCEAAPQSKRPARKSPAPATAAGKSRSAARPSAKGKPSPTPRPSARKSQSSPAAAPKKARRGAARHEPAFGRSSAKPAPRGGRGGGTKSSKDRRA